MSSTGTVPSYARATAVQWRDTGRRVVALPPGTLDVQVLGGGAAAVWRLLETPTGLPGILKQLGDTDGPQPGLADVADCLESLVGIGLLEEVP